MNYFCRLMQIPKWIRLLLSWLLIAIGLPLFLTPIPGGFLIATAGGMMLFCASPALRNRIRSWVGRMPRLDRRLAPLFQACDVCPNACRDLSSASGVPSAPFSGEKTCSDPAAISSPPDRSNSLRR